MAYIDGALEREKGNKDNFTEMLPLYTIGNKTSRGLGQAGFEKAIEKCEKAIKLHSIRRHPVWDKDRKKTAEDIEWLNRKEYNPFMWKVWLLMGRAQFHEGKFEDAISTFAYMSRLYATQPAIYQRAQAWLAKSYIEAGWQYEAEDVLRNMQILFIGRLKRNGTILTLIIIFISGTIIRLSPIFNASLAMR